MDATNASEYKVSYTVLYLLPTDLPAQGWTRGLGEAKPPCSQCSIFTGIILVYGVVLILLALVWYSGMRKWYANQFDFLRPLAGSISMSTCVQTCPDMVGHGWTRLDMAFLELGSGMVCGMADHF
jgi:hypothetical protein